jgi:myo-inositol 2-dehydrogenase/D-chiro-inositol 1-dehydrogenase
VSAPIRIGLLGTGRIGRLHARLIANEVEGFDLASVYDVDPNAGQEVARAVGADVTSSAGELLERSTTDAVAICTSTDTHIDLLVAAAEVGKPVFLEKPLSLDLPEVDRGIAAAEDAGL